MIAYRGGPLSDATIAAGIWRKHHAMISFARSEQIGIAAEQSYPRKRVRPSVLRTPRSVIVHIHDSGKGFSLDLLSHAAISNPENSLTKHVKVRMEEGRLVASGS